MRFDKNKFFNYLKEEKKLNNNLTYLYNLYKTYALTQGIIEKMGNDGRSFIKKQEDKIYDIDNKILTEQERINYELVNIGKKIKLNSANDIKVMNDVYEDYLDLLAYSKNSNFNDSLNIEYLKKQISILQAKFGLKNTFFLSAHDSFLELYRNLSLSIQDKNSETLEKKVK